MPVVYINDQFETGNMLRDGVVPKRDMICVCMWGVVTRVDVIRESAATYDGGGRMERDRLDFSQRRTEQLQN